MHIYQIRPRFRVQTDTRILCLRFITPPQSALKFFYQIFLSSTSNTVIPCVLTSFITCACVCRCTYKYECGCVGDCVVVVNYIPIKSLFCRPPHLPGGKTPSAIILLAEWTLRVMVKSIVKDRIGGGGPK